MTAGVKRRMYMEKLTNFSAAICDELKKTVEQIDENQARAFFELIQKKRSRAIFILGAGRCQYMLRAFCMRLAIARQAGQKYLILTMWLFGMKHRRKL